MEFMLSGFFIMDEFSPCLRECLFAGFLFSKPVGAPVPDPFFPLAGLLIPDEKLPGFLI